MLFFATVAVLVYAPPSGGAVAERDAAERALAQAERARGHFVVDDAVERARRVLDEGWVDRGELAFFARALPLIQEGRRALEHVELERAVATLAQAEAALDAELWRPGAADAAATAAAWRGVALYELGRKVEADHAWRRATALEPATELTVAMVRPEVARAFAAARTQPPIGAPPPAPPPHQAARALESLRARPSAAGADALITTLELDAVVLAAASRDGGRLIFTATRRQPGCNGALVSGARADEIARRLDESGCEREAMADILDAPAVAHPRPAPRPAARVPLVRRPWLWMTVVGALAIGVVVGATRWPRDPSYTARLDLHHFALSLGR